jgi:E1A/CREB-binding protein
MVTRRPCFTAQPNARKIDETRTRISEDERLARAAQLQRTMQLLVHASECRDPHCVSSNCRKIKEMFMHAHSCKVKVTGGCQLCRCAAQPGRRCHSVDTAPTMAC